MLLVYVPVRGIYKTKDGLLPVRMCWMTPDAAAAFSAADAEFEALGIPIRYSDCYRDRAAQYQAWADHRLWIKSGGKEGKAAYSPPPGFSMHEAGRARDYDAGIFAERPDLAARGLNQRTVVEVFSRHGIVGIVDVGDPCRVDVSEEWHFEYRGDFQVLYDKYARRGTRKDAYREMALRAVQAVGEKDYGTLPETPGGGATRKS